MPSSSKDPQLLRAIILEHYQHPKNKVDKAPAKSSHLTLHNKSVSCIDDFTVYLQIDEGRVSEALFSGIGCAISTAAASIATAAITGMTVAQASHWLQNYEQMIKGGEHDEQLLGEAVAFCTINKLPNRMNCALAVPDPLHRLLKEPTAE